MKGHVTVWACVVGLGALLAGSPVRAATTNYMELTATRVDDQTMPYTGFRGHIEVVLGNETDVSSVTVATPGGLVPLIDVSGNGTNWVQKMYVPDLATFTSATSGAWMVTVNQGASTSTLNFTLNTSELTDADFYPTPTGLSPGQGATGVPGGATLSWTGPAGSATSQVLESDISDNLGHDQQVLSLDATNPISLAATSWTPAGTITANACQWEVGYYQRASSSLVTSLSSAGSVAWDTSPYAGIDWTSGVPLVIVGSQSIVSFNQSTPEPASVVLLGLGGLLLWARRRRA